MSAPRKGRKQEETTAQPPQEQPVILEVFRDLTTGGRVTVVYEVPGEAWFRECHEGDEMPCKVLRVVDSQPRTRPEPQAVDPMRRMPG